MYYYFDSKTKSTYYEKCAFTSSCIYIIVYTTLNLVIHYIHQVKVQLTCESYYNASYLYS